MNTSVFYLTDSFLLFKFYIESHEENVVDQLVEKVIEDDVPLDIYQDQPLDLDGTMECPILIESNVS